MEGPESCWWKVDNRAEDRQSKEIEKSWIHMIGCRLLDSRFFLVLFIFCLFVTWKVDVHKHQYQRLIACTYSQHFLIYM